MGYSEKDLERAQSLARTHLSVAELQDYEVEAVAQLLATVRRETVEECLRIADRSWAHDVPRRIRALLDEPKAETRCKACGGPVDAHGWTDCPHFEPEEPGHGQ